MALTCKISVAKPQFQSQAKVLQGSRKSSSISRKFQIQAYSNGNGPRVAIAGSTGAVGQEFIRLIEEKNFPYSELKLLASSRSAGQQSQVNGKTVTVQELNESSFKDVDIALFSAGGSISKKFGPIAADQNCVVVDNSSAFRMTNGVPLIIPEVNKKDMSHVKIGNGAIIANPNCSTIIGLMAITPLHLKAKVKRVVVSTYQAASGAGYQAMQELNLQTKEALEGKPITQNIFPFQYAFNLFSHNSPMKENGYNEEEMKMVHETHKIWNNPNIQINPTCIRVPVMRAHAESINLEFENDITEEEAIEALTNFPGVTVFDDRKNNQFPTPLMVSDKDDVYVGRIRKDYSLPGNKGLSLFVCGDQIRKGAALNAMQIAEALL